MSKLVDHPTSLPKVSIPQDTDASAIVSSFASRLNNLNAKDFKHDAVWRDIFALTGTLRTFYTAATISLAYTETAKIAKAHSFIVDEKKAVVVRTPQGASWVQGQFTFETDGAPPTRCVGLVTIVLEEDGEWRIWTLRTVLEGLKGERDVDILEPVLGNGDEKLVNGHGEENHFDCIVIGGGQAGLSQGGRLKALGLSYVVLDKYEEVGDSWNKRYGSVRLHTTREYSHLPFERTFSSKYPEWLSKDDLAEGYREWVAKHGINVWRKTTALSGSWDSTKTQWSLKILREGEERLITSSFIVMAGGAGGQMPKMPEYANRELFRGVVMHSAEYKDSYAWKGKRGVVIGTANTGHDIADDMIQAGLSSVTMIQRGNTYVLPTEHYKKTADLNYNSTLPTPIGDLNAQTQPLAISDLLSQSALHAMADTEAPRFDDLEKAGFKLDRYGSIINCLYNRGGGHYMDVGTSAKISSGLIKIKAAKPTAYTKTGLTFEDGSSIQADVIVFATGFEGNMRFLVDQIFGKEIADQMGDYWGLDADGEIKGAWKECGHESMWYHGGTIGQARYMSRFVALQILAKRRGTPLRIYSESLRA